MGRRKTARKSTRRPPASSSLVREGCGPLEINFNDSIADDERIVQGMCQLAFVLFLSAFFVPFYHDDPFIGAVLANYADKPIIRINI